MSDNHSVAVAVTDVPATTSTATDISIAITSIPVYSPEELLGRCRDGSVDLMRLAATLALTMQTTSALADWANQQIKAGAMATGAVEAVSAPASSGKRK